MEYINEKPAERRVDDGLINFTPVTEAVREFAEAEFEGWWVKCFPFLLCISSDYVTWRWQGEDTRSWPGL